MSPSRRWFSLLCGLVALLFFASLPGGRLTPAVRAQSASPQPPPTRCPAPTATPDASPDGRHVFTSSYYRVAADLETTLLLNNKSPRPLAVQPTLFALDGRRLDAPPVIVPEQSFRVVSLTELGARPRTPFAEGSLELRFAGPPLVLGAQVEMRDRRGRLISDRLSDARVALATTRLAGVYRLPRGGVFKLAVTNVTDAPVEATLRLNGAAGDGLRLRLDARATWLVDVGEALGRGKLPAVGGVVIESERSGTVRANGWVWNEAGYASEVTLSNLTATRTAVWHVNGVQVQPMGGRAMTPYVTLHNFGRETSDARVRLVGTLDGEVVTRALPTMRLGPGETATIAVTLERREAERMTSAGLELAYATEPGTVGAAVVAEREDGARAVRVPVLDAETIPSATGSYPWRIGTTENTVVYLKNATDKEARYHASLNFEGGGAYGLGQARLRPGETVAIDIRRLRYLRKPDEAGNVFPDDAKRGQFLWSVHGVELKGIIGRAAYVDEAAQAVSTYACYNCCGDVFATGWLAGPSVIGATLGSWFTAFEQYATCYGTLHPAQLAWVENWWQTDAAGNPATGLAALTATQTSQAEATGLVAGSFVQLAGWTVFDCTLGALPYVASLPVEIKPVVRVQSARVDPAELTPQGLTPKQSKCFFIIRADGLPPAGQIIVTYQVTGANQTGPGNIRIENWSGTLKLTQGRPQAEPTADDAPIFVADPTPAVTRIQPAVGILQTSQDFIIAQPNPLIPPSQQADGTLTVQPPPPPPPQN